MVEQLMLEHAACSAMSRRKRRNPRILITGNMGYVGSVLSRHLRERLPGAELTGYDSALFAHCLTGAGRLPEAVLDRQIFGDVRDMTPDLFAGIDAVVHLAAISNDPMGHRFEQVTDEVNHRASLRCAMLARDAGVAHFVFASSCSVYGFSDAAERGERDAVHPLTAYARSKIAVETALDAADLGAMTITCLRFATACGVSDRIRLDLVLNDFVASALACGEILVLSDGTPWRPLIDVADMARAIEWAVSRGSDRGGARLRVNVGCGRWNYRVRDLAEAVAAEIGGARITMKAQATGDARSYRVDFSLFERLAPQHQPMAELARSVRQLRERLSAMAFADSRFREGSLIRLKVLEGLVGDGRVTPDLRWRDAPSTAFDDVAPTRRPRDRHADARHVLRSLGPLRERTGRC